MSNQDAELLEMVKALTAKVDALEVEIKSLKLQQTVPDEVLVAISAAVAAYLGLRAKKRQMTFDQSRNWTVTTRRSQHVHAPLYIR